MLEMSSVVVPEMLLAMLEMSLMVSETPLTGVIAGDVVDRLEMKRMMMV